MAEKMPQAAQKPKEIRIQMPTSVYQAANLRDLLFAVTQNVARFPEKWAFRLQAVADELCNNAIEHGSVKDDFITIILQIMPGDKLVIMVEDNGQGKTKTTATELQAHIQKVKGEKEASGKVTLLTTALRGRGLANIVYAWTDEIKFEDKTDGGIRAIASKSLATIKEEEETMTEAEKTDTIAEIKF